MRCPTCRTLQDSVIQANWKERIGLAFAFFPQSRLYLMFDPVAFDRMLGEDQQKFLMQSNGLVNARAELLANLQIMRGEPAGNIILAQIGMEPFGHCFILVCIADE